jgi:hypothetical protein
MKSDVVLLPRIIRKKNAPAYLGMSRPEFEKRVEPHIACLKYEGSRAVNFDRLDLDAWIDQLKAANGKSPTQMGITKWQNQRQGLENGVNSGISKKQSAGSEFAKARAAVISQKQSVT